MDVDDVAVAAIRLGSRRVLHAMRGNLRIAEQMSQGLAQVCRGVSVCVVGGSVMDTWANAAGTPRR